MVGFSVIFVFSVYFYLSKVLECDSISRSRCPTIDLDHGRVSLRSSGRFARITCLPPFKLVRGNKMANCVQGRWNTENPICAREGCPIQDIVPHGRLDVLNEGASLEVICDIGYTIDGPSFVYCNEDLEWNQELKGCVAHDQIFLSCDFESSDERFCGWKNDIFNDIDWLADKMTFILFSTRRHVSPGSSQYFKSNYISLDAGNYGSTTTGKLSSPILPPARNKQRCLIFAYKVMSGNSNGIPILKVTFGGIPHWESHEGEGRVIIGLYQFNITTKIKIEGRSCRAAIDNIIITEGDSCNDLPYEEEINSCHDNCGKITSGRCSCDWECYNNRNCCPDIQIKCPYIVSMDDITRLYLTTATTAAKTTVTTTEKNTFSNVTVKNIMSSIPVITTPKNGQNDTTIIKKNTTASTVKPSNITSTFASASVTNSTTKPTTVSIPLTTASTEVSKRALLVNSTTSRSINPHVINTSPNVSTVIPNIVMDIQNNNSKIISTPSMTIIPNISSSTIEPFTINKTFDTEKLNITPTAITKSSMVNTTISMTSLNPRPDKLNPTMKVVFIPTTITKSVVENTSLATSTLVNLTISTVKSLNKYSTLSTGKQINLSSKTAKSITDNSTSTIALINNTTKLPIKPSILANSNEQLSNKSLNTQQTKQNTITNENNTTTINNLTTLIPTTVKYLSGSIVPDKKLVVFDISDSNPNLKQFEYNRTLNNQDLLNITTESYKLSDLRSTSTPIKNENRIQVLKVHKKSESNNLFHNSSSKNIDNQSAEHVKQNENAKSSYTFNTITIIKYIAAIGVVLLTFKFTLSFILLRFNNIPSDKMDERFIETDNESSCNMELTSNHKE